MQKYYKAEMDRLLRISTRVVFFIFLIPPVALFFAWQKAIQSPPLPPLTAQLLYWGIPLLAVSIICTAYIAWAMAPKGYALSDLGLLIDRRMRPINIPLNEITEVRQLEKGRLGKSLRLMGTSGFYGHYGLFWSRELGKFRAYVTRSEDLAAVRTEKTLFVLSPENPEEFVQVLGKLLPRK